MEGDRVLLLGLGIESPWTPLDHRMDTDKQPHELHLHVGSKYACPVCGASCP